MLRSAAVPMKRAWNTWSSRPAEMVFLPLGVRITPLAYADSTRAATLFPPGEGVLYGRHALDGSLVEMDLSHAGTRLAWRYRKAEPFEILGLVADAEIGRMGASLSDQPLSVGRGGADGSLRRREKSRDRQSRPSLRGAGERRGSGAGDGSQFRRGARRAL